MLGLQCKQLQVALRGSVFVIIGRLLFCLFAGSFDFEALRAGHRQRDQRNQFKYSWRLFTVSCAWRRESNYSELTDAAR